MDIYRRAVLNTIGALGTVGVLDWTGSAKAADGAVLSEGFEDVSVGSYPGSWSRDGNKKQLVTDSVAGEGTRALEQRGSGGGCWQALGNAPANLPTERAVTITGMVRPTSEGSYGCHDAFRAHLKFRTDVGSWSAGESTRFLTLKPDGTVVGRGGTEVGTYTTGEWNTFEITYDPTGDVVSLTYVINGSAPKTYDVSKAPFEGELAYMTLASGDFVTQWDGFSIVDANQSDETTSTSTDGIADNISIETVTVDRNPAKTVPHTTQYAGLHYDSTATLFGAPVSTSLIIELVSGVADKLHIDEAVYEITNESGQTVVTETQDLAGYLETGTYTYRVQLRGDLDPGTYDVTVKLRKDQATIGYDYVVVGTGSTSLTVVDAGETPIVTVPRVDLDSRPGTEPHLGNMYTVSLSERSPTAKFVRNTIDIITGLWADDTLPTFGVDKAKVNDLAANTAQVRMRSTSDELDIFWENKEQYASGGGTTFGVWYDRAVLTAKVPADVTVEDAPNADYVVRDTETGETIVTWVRTAVDKGIPSKPSATSFDFDEPTGSERLSLSAPSERTAEIATALNLELGPFRGEPRDQAKYHIPVEGDKSELEGIYDYEAWQSTPSSVNWMTAGATTDTHEVALSGDTSTESKTPTSTTTRSSRQEDSTGLSETIESAVDTVTDAADAAKEFIDSVF